VKRISNRRLSYSTVSNKSASATSDPQVSKIHNQMRIGPPEQPRPQAQGSKPKNTLILGLETQEKARFASNFANCMAEV
jgi:hypothetical protein